MKLHLCVSCKSGNFRQQASTEQIRILVCTHRLSAVCAFKVGIQTAFVKNVQQHKYPSKEITYAMDTGQ